LAKEIGVPADTLQTTLDTWNKAVADKNDVAFGRTSGMDRALDTGSYHAIKVAPGIHHTMGGVKINTNTQVLKTDGSAISALYAAGEVTGGVHGQNRIGGNAVADIIVFGRQAGEQAAGFAKK
jgi:fumarate reductase flavoprotein subunit